MLALTSAQGLGRVKTQTLNLRVEQLSFITSVVLPAETATILIRNGWARGMTGSEVS